MKTAEEKAYEYVSNEYRNIHHIEAIKDYLAGYEEAYRWIPVEEELPELPDKITHYNQNRFLVKYDTGGVDISAYNRKAKNFAVESAWARPRRKVVTWRKIEME